MKKLSLLLSMLLILCLLPTLAFAQINIVATLPTLGAIAKEIGGPNVTVHTLASSREDPHFVDPRPDFVLKLNKADVLIYNGMEYEIGWLPTLQNNARNSKVDSSAQTAIDASKFIVPLDVPTQKIERSAGDIHAQGNPHYLFSLTNIIAVTKGITDALIDIDPDNAESYRTNSHAFLTKANKLNDTWIAKFKALDDTKRRIVSYHDSMIYLRTWLLLDQVATIEPKPGISPNPAHVAKVVSRMKKDDINIILQETYQPTSTSQKIAKMVNAKLVVIAAGPNVSKNESLLDYVENMLKDIYNAIAE